MGGVRGPSDLTASYLDARSTPARRAPRMAQDSARPPDLASILLQLFDATICRRLVLLTLKAHTLYLIEVGFHDSNIIGIAAGPVQLTAGGDEHLLIRVVGFLESPPS